MVRTTVISQSSHAQNASASRRTRRAIIGALGGAALLAAGFGCTGWSADSCDAYLLCVSATMPLAQSDQLALYGKDGTCWKQIDPEQCARSCKAGLKALAATTDAKECHPSTSSGGGDDTTTDPPITTFSWQLPSKTMFYSGPSFDPKLTGEDPLSGNWLCTRDDKNQSPSTEILRMHEPNDLPDTAVSVVNPLPVDPSSGYTAGSFEICPDRSAPGISDYDTYKFVVNNPGHIISEIRYQVKYGDLDISLFREDGTSASHKLSLVGANVTGVDNACIERDLTPGTYYLVVYGARDPVMQSKTAMNRYSLRVFEVQTSGYTCS